MKEMTFEEMKQVQLSIMDKFHNWCEMHNFNYTLGCGTLIGAIRHQGYIPWDDDIDVCLIRSEYDRLLKEFNETAPENLRLRSVETDSTYYTPFAKIEDTSTYLIEEWANKYDIGVNIDVFPIDAIPDNKFSCKLLFFKKRIWLSLLSMKNASVKNRKKSFLKKLIIQLSNVLVAPIPIRYIGLKLSKLANKKDTTSKLIMDVSSIFMSPQKAYPRSVFDDRIKVKFEGREYNAISGYDLYLRKTYGDYMQLPPVEKRVAHHPFTPYWK